MIVVAYLNLHYSELVQECFTDEDTGLNAMNEYLSTSFETEDEIYQYCADCDSFISYIEI